MKCVKIERVALCNKGEFEVFDDAPWTEIWSPVWVHPYNKDKESFLRECGGRGDIAVLSPIVGADRDYMTDDLACIADRMTVDIGQSENRTWGEMCSEFIVNISSVCDAPRMFTVNGGDGDFATFRATPMDRIPDLQPWATPKTSGGIVDVTTEIPDRVYAIVRNSIHEANGEPLEELPTPLRTFRVRVSRIDDCEIEVEAVNADDAVRIARANRLGWLQSDPDKACDDWEYDFAD